MFRFSMISLAVALAGCDPAAEEPFAGPDPTPAQLDDAEFAAKAQLWTTCGDPVCAGWSPKGLPNCRAHKAGDKCSLGIVGKECDPHDACNATLECETSDPKAGGCPVSVRSAKKEISYLTDADERSVHDALINVRLANWRYNQESDAVPTHLGFIIDDVGQQPMVAADGGHVDLYGYTSMAVAAVQVQQKQIDALQAQIKELQAQLAAQKTQP
jgi:hypothetical protein